MTKEEAYKSIEDIRSEQWIDFGLTTVCLDGSFTSEQLKRIVDVLEAIAID